MKSKLTRCLFGFLLLAATARSEAQSTWNYLISDAGAGNSLLTWNVTGTLTAAPGAAWWSTGPLLAVPISAPGIYADAYLADGTPQFLAAPDGSYFLDSVGGQKGFLTGFYTYSAGGGGDDGFGLMVSIFSTRSGDHLLYNAGTESVLIPVAFSEFNPGTYQSQIAGFSPAVTVNLTVVPEPSSVAFVAAGALTALSMTARRRRPA